MKNFSKLQFHGRLALELWKWGPAGLRGRKLIHPDPNFDLADNCISNPTAFSQVGPQLVEKIHSLDLFFFFFYGFHSFCHGKSFSLLCVYNFPLLIWGLAWKGIYSCLWGWASLRTIFLGKVTCWYPTNKIVLQAKMCSSHPQGQRHWS